MLRTPVARVPARPGGVVIRGSLIETVLPTHCGATFGS
jgi:hypothetical protein